MTTYLDRILAGHRAAAAADHRDLADLADLAERAAVAALAAGTTTAPGTRTAAESAVAAEETAAGGARRGFAAALVAAPGLAVIAEVKRRSPSRGALAEDIDPATVARQYAAGGAACLSVLTDAEWFGGSPADLVSARAACDLPVLRKDFTVAPADVYDARIMGADAVLLIAAALEPGELADLLALATVVGLDALVEVHDEAEAEVALAAGATLVGVNQRDLVTFEVDGHRAERLAKLLPDGIVKVAESGVRSRGDAARLEAAGYDAILVGESVVTAADRSAAVRALRTA